MVTEQTRNHRKDAHTNSEIYTNLRAFFRSTDLNRLLKWGQYDSKGHKKAVHATTPLKTLAQFYQPGQDNSINQTFKS